MPDEHWEYLPASSMGFEFAAVKHLVFAQVSELDDSNPDALRDAFYWPAAGSAESLFANRREFSFPNYCRFYDGYYLGDR